MRNKYQHGPEFNINQYSYSKKKKISEYFLIENNLPADRF